MPHPRFVGGNQTAGKNNAGGSAAFEPHCDDATIADAAEGSAVAGEFAFEIIDVDAAVRGNRLSANPRSLVIENGYVPVAESARKSKISEEDTVVHAPVRRACHQRQTWPHRAAI